MLELQFKRGDKLLNLYGSILNMRDNSWCSHLIPCSVENRYTVPLTKEQKYSPLRLHFTSLFKESLIKLFNETPKIIAREVCVIIYKIALLYTKVLVHAVKRVVCRSEAVEFKVTLPTGAPAQKWGPVAGGRIKMWISN